MGLLKRVIAKITHNSGMHERFDYSYDPSTVILSKWAAHYMIYKKFLEYAKRVPTLDLCCGSGAGTKLIADTIHIPVIGVDYSEKAINFAINNNKISLIEFVKMDISQNIKKLETIIKNNKIKQAFFIESIEHIKNDFELLDLMFTNGVETIFVSTPNEKEDVGIHGYHINPIIPSKMKKFQEKYKITMLEYLRFVDIKTIDQKNFMKTYFTDNSNDGLNYLFIINMS